MGASLRYTQRLGLVVLATVACCLLSVSAAAVAAGRHQQSPSPAAVAAGDGDATPQWLYASAAPSLYHSYDTAPRLHFAVISLPMPGHFQAVHAAAEELTRRGHHVTYFVEHQQWCEAVRPSAEDAAAGSVSATRGGVDCVVVVGNDTNLHQRQQRVRSDDDAAAHLPSLADRARQWAGRLRGFGGRRRWLLSHHARTLPLYLEAVVAAHAGEPFTTFLCGLNAYACSSVARRLDVSMVHVLPHTPPELALGLHTELPAAGTAFPQAMSTWQRTRNYFVKVAAVAAAELSVVWLNRQRGEHGIAPYRDSFDVAGLYDTVIVPGLWGLEVAQPLCPNVHAVGHLLPRAVRTAGHHQLSEGGLRALLDKCEQGVVYVDLGGCSCGRGAAANASSTPRSKELAEALRRTPFCVVWSATADAAAPSSLSLMEEEGRASRIAPRPSPAAHAGIMRHPNVFALASRCGAMSSVVEATEAGVPVVCLPTAADRRSGACQRAEEASVGVCLPGGRGIAAGDVEEAIWDVVRRHGELAGNIRRMQVVSAALGGPARAADVIELRQYNLFLRRGDSMEACAALSRGVWAVYGLTPRLLLFVAAFLLWWAVLAGARQRWLLVCNCKRLRTWLRVFRGTQQPRTQPSDRLRIVPRRYRRSDDRPKMS